MTVPPALYTVIDDDDTERYNAYMALLDELMDKDPPSESVEGRTLATLALICEDWENRNVVIMTRHL